MRWVTVLDCQSFDRDENTTNGRCVQFFLGPFVFELWLTRR